MQLFDFSHMVGRPITLYGSENIIFTPLLLHEAPTKISCMHVAPEGVIGFHEATVDQLFLVVAGSGWVRGEEAERTAIEAGEAAFWTAGEWHESGSAAGMTAIIVEGDGLEPAKRLPLLAD